MRSSREWRNRILLLLRRNESFHAYIANFSTTSILNSDGNRRVEGRINYVYITNFLKEYSLE